MIVRLNGGLGNQMFQYAFGRSVALARGENLFFEKYELDRGKHRAYGLGVFNTIVGFVMPSGPQYMEPTFSFDENVYKVPNGTHFIGNWQTEKYFNNDIVRYELTPKTLLSEQSNAAAVQIMSGPSCFIHVRRTDYLVPSVAAYHGNMGMDYYNEAMKYVRSRVAGVKFYIFSDDPDWCRENMEGIVIDHNKPGSGESGPGMEHEDLVLMALCNHAIIPNSSFSWWGAWKGDHNPMNKNRIVIAPKNWFAGASLDTKDIRPERWIQL